MTPIHVVGIGLEGAAGLTSAVRDLVVNADWLVGSDRHLGYFPDHPAARIRLGDLRAALAQIRQSLAQDPQPQIVILTSGDPLCFGLGRLLLAELPAEQLTFHPHLSALQLAFSRIKVPWQDAEILSAHGRSLETLIQALRRGADKIAVLTDLNNTPAAIARTVLSLDLPSRYQLWVCENLGGPTERVTALLPEQILDQEFAPLTVVVLLRTLVPKPPGRMPVLGLSDQEFCSFPDRPGLITKREVRVLALAELELQPDQVVWDIGTGTGSVAIEAARLIPTSKVYAVEKTAAGMALIGQNCQRFQVENLVAVHGSAPEALLQLPDPDRIFIGGSGGQLLAVLEAGTTRLRPGGILVIALATLEHFSSAIEWLQRHHHTFQVLQIQLARSVSVAALTRLTPLNPVYLLKVQLPSPCLP